jgi:hypothetical protein
MKKSHYTTPRSLEACQFAHDADPIDYGQRGIDYQDKIVLWGCAIVVFIAVVLILSGAVQ